MTFSYAIEGLTESVIFKPPNIIFIQAITCSYEPMEFWCWTSKKNFGFVTQLWQWFLVRNVSHYFIKLMTLAQCSLVFIPRLPTAIVLQLFRTCPLPSVFGPQPSVGTHRNKKKRGNWYQILSYYITLYRFWFRLIFTLWDRPNLLHRLRPKVPT